MVEGGGFEPPKASPTDLQSVPFDHSGTPPFRNVISQHESICEFSFFQLELAMGLEPATC